MLFNGPLSFDRLKILTDYNDTAPILIRNLKRLGLLSKHLGPVLKDAELRKLRSVQFSAELALVFSLFQKNNIRALSLKGPVLAQQIYSSVSLRSCSDLDIYVEPRQYSEARDLLLNNGYHPIDHISTNKRLNYTLKNSLFHHTDLTRNGIVIELHWKDLDLEPVSFESLYERCTKEVLCDTEIYVPGTADTLIMLIRHGCRHGFFKLKWIMDVFELLLKADSKTLNHVCAQMNNSNHLFALFAFFLLAERLHLFSVEIENNEKTEIIKNPDQSFIIKTDLSGNAFLAAKQLSEIAFSRLIELDSSSIIRIERTYTLLYRDIQYRLGLADRHKNIIKLISPGNQDFELINLPDSLFILYYPIRIGYWIWRRVLHRQSAPD